MSEATPAAIERVLKNSRRPLSVAAIAGQLDAEADRVAQAIWDSPHIFAWQPGGLWTLGIAKGSAADLEPKTPDHLDTRPAVLTPQAGVELRAMTLANGALLRVISRPLDTSAVLSVKQTGGDLQLILNSSHEAFARFPVPFDDDESKTDYKGLIELLLAAWAVYEGSAPASGSRHTLDDARFMWGRSVLYLLESGR